MKQAPFFRGYEQFWCSSDKTTKELLIQAEERKEKILQLFDTFVFDDFELTYRFVELLSPETECFCRGNQFPEPIRLKKKFESGRTGDAWLISRRKVNFVLKRIQVSIPKYLSIDAVLLTDNLKLVSPGVVNNRVLVRDSRGQEQEMILTSGNNLFVNQTIISLLLEYHLDQDDNYTYQFDAFFCGGYGYNILEYQNNGDLYDFLETTESLSEELLLNICQSIFHLIGKLKQPYISFCHNDLKCKNILVNRNKKGKISFMLSDFDKSTIFHHGCYFYPKGGTGTGLTGAMRSFVPSFEQHYEKGKVQTTMYYRLNLAYGDFLGIPFLQAWTMFSGKPFYLSLDFYTFLFSFFGHPKIYRYLIQNQDSFLWELLKTMWIRPEDEEQFLNYLKNSTPEQSQSLTSILKHFSSKDYYFRYSFKPFMKIVNLKYRQKRFRKRYFQELYQTKQGNFCISDCEDICDTNAYSVTSGYFDRTEKIYIQDQCT